MPKYKFVGVGPGGKKMGSVVSASSRDVAVIKLKKIGVKVEFIQEYVAPKSTLFSRKSKVKQKDIVLFTRQFAVMQDSGMGLIDTFEILSKQSTNPALTEMILKIKTTIEGGSTLADALKLFPKNFNVLYVNMVRVGEMSGSLSDVFNKLAEYMERSMKLARQVKTALIYPSVVISAALLIVWGLLVFVVPVFEKIFQQAQGDLPLPTKILVTASNIVRENFIFSVVLLVAFIFLFKAYSNTKRGRYTIDKNLLKIPLIGGILLKVSVSKFTTTLGSLIASGVPIVDGLELASGATGNAVIGEAVESATQEVVDGRPLALSIEKTGLFPPMVVNMIRVGEETGNLDTMLTKVNDFYEDEVDSSIKGLTSAMEPILIVGLGSLIAAFVVALYMPVFKLATAMGG